METMKKQRVAVIGKGLIGISWAVLFAGNGFGVTVFAKDPELGLKRFRDYFRDLVDRELVTEKQAVACEKGLRFTEDYAELSAVELVFEAVAEKLEAKRSVYRQVVENCPKLVAIASATSAFVPEKLAEGMPAREKIFVAHPWNPPHLVPCVEVAKNEDTDEDAIKAVLDVLEYCGREVILLNKPFPGFVGNRLQHAIFREAIHIVESGVCSAEDVDRVARYSFIPRYTSIGLFEHLDYAGLDLARNIQEYLLPQLCSDETVSDYLQERCGTGNIGYKSGVGVYDWRERDMDAFRKRTCDPYLEFFNWKLPED